MSQTDKKSAAKDRITALSEQINYHNHLYYQEDRTEISDFEFDQLLEELIALETEFPEFLKEDSPSQRVGGTITKDFETVEHRYKMLSLGNTYSEEELKAFDERVAKGLGHRNYSYFCELKFDGVAISLVYENGKLVRAVTRGDGYKGDNVTANIKTIRNIPLTVIGEDIPDSFEVRGEIFLPRKEFDRINQERAQNEEALLANPRNAASGTVKMQDSSIVAKRRLNCYFYQLLGEDLQVSQHDEAIHLLEKWGFNVSPTYQKCQDVTEVLQYIELWREKRFELPLETDGVVLKINSYDQREELGFTAKIPRWAIAYKYQAESAETELLSITYQVGRTGAITPVAQLKPVSLAGTTVKRASLHNANEILRLDLHEGDFVFVEKGGEIIPKITGVSLDKRRSDTKPISYITECPECGTSLIRNEGEAKHYCPNAQTCPPQALGRIEHFTHKRAMDIDTMGTERIRALIEQHLIVSPADIYELPEKKEQLLGLEVNSDQYTKSSEGYLFVSLKKALYAITKTIPLAQIDNFLAENEGVEQRELLEKFENYVRKAKKNIAYNVPVIWRLKDALQNSSFDHIEDYLPVPVVLAVIFKKPAEDFRTICRKENTVHDIMLKYEGNVDGAQTEQINRIKGNTFQEGVVSNMVKGIEESKKQPFEKVLFALGIRNIGENTAQLLAKHFKSIEKLKAASPEELLEINGIGETLVTSLQAFFQDEENNRTIERLKNHGLRFEIEEKEQKLESRSLEGMKILASGKLNHFKRDEIIEVVQSHGGTYVKSVSKSLDFIIEGEDMGPSKKEKAEKLGVKLISEQEFMDLIS
ncbi:NAD-dependent DNA ligase LigA [Litoribacter alkaliphilus]|uniref:DNA ligase n=1 Tax=Litoribacter ruber TaxID=702568 RepID=A0AAP2CJW2_9BACT|nr:NAD-dependent DNA ligase LigA [Litoribacter alkaliphilus]MBS9523137.1 NAD-dependent DNA ligase LigA [Litoribacter alkaliphilus]